jgi:hypothetical protein
VDVIDSVGERDIGLADELGDRDLEIDTLREMEAE